MRVIIMGSGRTGSRLAGMLSRAGQDVTVIDWNEQALDRIPDDFAGQTIVGNAIDQDVLREAGIESADVFVAATSGDNRNIMASEIAYKVFSVPRVVCRVKDPNRARIFEGLGIIVDCRTTQGTQAILDMIGEKEAVASA
ncbi:MAG TPA: TrkA family potassium uptake protein [Chloroflexota bacterium]|nr:TrkA family potassium uptake protein [Chloroflexota bacterium]